MKIFESEIRTDDLNLKGHHHRWGLSGKRWYPNL